MTTVAVIGAGAWGTALAVLASRRGHDVRLWVRRPDLATAIDAGRENSTYLPGVKLDPAITVTADSARIGDAAMVLSVLPVQHTRSVLSTLASHIAADATLVICSKGTDGWLEINGSTWRTFMGRTGEPGPSSDQPEVEEASGYLAAPASGGHYTNFLKAVRSGNPADLNCDIYEGFLSSALPHLANISCAKSHSVRLASSWATLVLIIGASGLLSVFAIFRACSLRDTAWLNSPRSA